MVIDGCCWANRRGFGRFTRELLGPLVEQAVAADHRPFLVVDQATARSSDFPEAATLEVVETSVQPTRAAIAEGSRSVFDLWRIRQGMLGLRPDVVFFPAVYSYVPLPSRVPTVATFHDAIAEEHPSLVFPHWKGRLFWGLKTRWALRQACRLLTVSNSARQQIVDAFDYPADRIVVTEEAPSPSLAPIEDSERLAEVRRRHAVPEDVPILLYVGGISPHKNLDGLVAALCRVETPWHLVLVGDHLADGFLSCHRDLMSRIESLGLTTRVTFTGFVSNEDLAALYSLAKLLVLPSFSEGFGLPAVEAMACGLPVAVSHRGSLPEVVGSAGELFDPHDPESMAACIQALLTDPGRLDRLAERALERAQDFSWNRSARTVLRLLESVGSESRGER